MMVFGELHQLGGSTEVDMYKMSVIGHNSLLFVITTPIIISQGISMEDCCAAQAERRAANTAMAAASTAAAAAAERASSASLPLIALSPPTD
jgi:hypothetical protein